MHDAGFKNIVNTDYSEVCIEKMSSRYPDQSWRVSDATNMKEFADGSIDVVLDKGTMDALLVNVKYFEPNDPTAQAMTDEVYRVLKSGGKYIQITFDWHRKKVRRLRKNRFVSEEAREIARARASTD